MLLENKFAVFIASKLSDKITGQVFSVWNTNRL